MDVSSDDVLIQRIAAKRDEAAFTELYRRYETSAYQLALYLTGNQGRAEEALQDAMLAIWNGAARFQPGNARGWLMSIVAQKSIRLKRGIVRNEVSMDMATLKDKVETHSDALEGEGLEHREMLASLREVLSQLPEQERQLVGLYYAGGLSQDQIASALRIPQQTISTRLRGVLDGLRTYLLAKGFASVVPLTGGALNADLLREAIYSGARPPHGLTELVVSKTLSAAHASVRVAAATTAKGGAAFLWMSGVSVMFVLAGVVTWAMSQKNHTVSTPKTPMNEVIAAAPVVPLVETVEAPALNVSWDFSKNSDAAKDLKTVVGTWEWKKGIGKQSGAMIPTTKVLVVKFPEKTPDIGKL
jgi:RNA polymerase sigma-70 factor (ECF subfamily)